MKHKNPNSILLLISFFVLSLVVPTNTFSEVGQDTHIGPPLGNYLLIRPCIIKGRIIKVGSFKAKIYVEKWIKGSKNRKKISVFHASSFQERNNWADYLNEMQDESYIFILRGSKLEKNNRLLLRDKIHFKIENDSIYIPKEYFIRTRNIDDNTRQLAEKVKKEGIRISVNYFEWLVSVVNEIYSLDEYQDCFRRADAPVELDAFSTLIVNDLKSEVCRH